jgi:riboflavin biosynthesis protein RibD
MAQALQLARRGLGTTWPNPSVGAIVVAPSGEILARAWTAPGGRPHAEAIALDSSGSRAKGSTLYVTLEPCAHAGGRGPACADLIARARPERAVIALRDPDPRTDGGGIERLIDAGIVVKEGVLAEEACAVTLGHLLRVTEGRPAVTLKLAVGSDGLMPKGNGAPVWITGPDARAHAHLLRARCDAIMVGRGTILADNPSLTCRLPGMACRSPGACGRRPRRRFSMISWCRSGWFVPPTKSIPIPMHCRTAALRSLPSPSMSMACLTSATRSRRLPAAASPASSSKAALRWRALFSMPTLSMRR